MSIHGSKLKQERFIEEDDTANTAFLSLSLFIRSSSSRLVSALLLPENWPS